MTKLSILQKTLLFSALVHVGFAVWFLPRTSVIQAPKARGVVDLELIEPVVHEEESSVERSKKRDVSRREDRNNPPRTGSPQAGTSNQTGPLGDPRSIARETDLFIQEISRLIDRNKVYPKEALSREEEGKVVVALTLDREGNIVEAKVEQPSPFGSLNQAALQSVQKIGRFPEIPEIVPVPLHLHIPIQFRIER